MMKLYLTALFMVIGILVAGNTYAAFPIANHNTIVSSATPTIAYTHEEPTTPKTPDHGRRIRNKSQAWALVICCLAGFVGAHRYYLGYILEGAIQTVTLGGMGVWWIIDLIRICTGDLQPKYNRYMSHFHWTGR